MAKSRTNGKKLINIGGIVKLKIVVERIHKSLLLGKNSTLVHQFTEPNAVPEDVKEGHFAVIAVDKHELKRFVLPLSYLTNSSFLRLLEQAEEEYGFNHEGALMVPCRPNELEQMLGQDRRGRVEDTWSSRNAKTMVIKS